MKLRLISEATVEDVQRRIPIWIKNYFGGNESKANEIIPNIISADPTKGKYSEWLIRQWKNKTARFPEDNEKLLKNLELFDQKKSRLDNKDINAYTPGALAETLTKQFKATGSERRDARKGGLQLPEGAKLVVDKGDWKAVKIITPEASSILCSGTEWCVANKETAQEYLKNGPLYLIYVNNQRKFLAHYESNQFMDVYDNDVSLHIKLSIIDLLHQVTGVTKENNAQIAYDCAKDMHGRFRAGEQAILKDHDIAVRYAAEIIKGRWPEAESAIATIASTSFLYAEDILKGRFPAAEPILAKDPYYAYAYAVYILKDRFPAGEPAIMHGDHVIDYIKRIIKNRWPEAEPIIAEDPHRSIDYAEYILKSRFPAGEQVISKYPDLSYRYAVNVIKGRFLKGEPAMIGDKLYKRLYEEFLNKLDW